MKEKIKKAAIKYDLEHPYLFFSASDHFIKGANWALSHQWISVEEQLPPFEQDVIVHYKWRNAEHYRFGHRTENPNVIVDKYGFANCINDEIITHWMSVPIFKEDEDRD